MKKQIVFVTLLIWFSFGVLPCLSAKTFDLNSPWGRSVKIVIEDGLIQALGITEVATTFYEYGAAKVPAMVLRMSEGKVRQAGANFRDACGDNEYVDGSQRVNRTGGNFKITFYDVQTYGEKFELPAPLAHWEGSNGEVRLIAAGFFRWDLAVVHWIPANGKARR